MSNQFSQQNMNNKQGNMNPYQSGRNFNQSTQNQSGRNFAKSNTNFNINQDVEIPIENFNFSLTHNNRVKPRDIRRIDLLGLINQNRTDEINDILSSIAQENFEENDYFDLTRDERSLIKKYQIVIQYMLYSINCLSQKNQLLNQVSEKQSSYNEDAEEVLAKQQKRIKEQNEEIEKLTNNCVNMEFLIRELGLEDQALQLGIALDKTEKGQKMKEREKQIINREDFHDRPQDFNKNSSSVNRYPANVNNYSSDNFNFKSGDSGNFYKNNETSLEISQSQNRDNLNKNNNDITQSGAYTNKKVIVEESNQESNFDNK